MRMYPAGRFVDTSKTAARALHAANCYISRLRRLPNMPALVLRVPPEAAGVLTRAIPHSPRHCHPSNVTPTTGSVWSHPFKMSRHLSQTLTLGIDTRISDPTRLALDHPAAPHPLCFLHKRAVSLYPLRL